MSLRRTLRPRPAAVLLPVALTLLAAGAAGQPAAAPGAPGAALEDDYGPDNAGWNGLRDLFALARGLGLRPEMRPDVVWDDLGDDAVLVIIYPRVKLDTDKLLAHVGGGGRLVVADDHGTSDALLERLGMTRHHGDARATRFYQDNPNLPVARALQEHELTRDVDEVVTNHPAWLRGSLTPLLGFAPGDIVCAAGQIGDGTIVLLADPSVLINNMLELSGNLAFAANLLRYVAKPGDRVVVVAGEFEQRGTPPRGWPPATAAGGTAAGPGAPAPPAGPVATFLREFNRFLGGMAAFTPGEETVRALLLAAAGALLIVLLFVVGGGAVRADGAWAHGGRPPRSAFEVVVRRYGTGRSPVGSGLLASLLRDDVEARLGRDLGLDPVSSLDPARAVPRARAVAGAEAARLLERLLPRLLRIPPTERAFGTYAPMSRHRLARLHAQVESLFAALDAATQRPEDHS